MAPCHWPARQVLAGAERPLATEGPPESAAVRFVKSPVICVAPQYAGEELLRAEGFTDIGYVAAKAADEIPPMLAQGRADFSLAFAVNHIATIEAGAPSEAEIVRAIFCRYAELCPVRLLKQELDTRGISRFQRCDPSTVDRHRMRELIREWIVYPFSARMREPRRPGAPR